MLRTILKAVVAVLGVLVLVGVALYQFLGLRIVLDGGGRPGFQFVESAAQQAERIARHREEQRALFASATDEAGAAERVAAAEDVAAPAGNGRTDATRPGGVAAPGSAPAQAERATGGVPGSAPRLVPPATAYWTEFRGPNRAGQYDELPIRLDWPAGGLKPIWKQPVGGGYASFAAARGRAFTIEQRAAREVVAAYEIATGRELWTDSWAAEFRESMGGDGPRATPVWADGRVYALGAVGELRALDETSGQVLWRTNILEDSGATNLPWGMAASPLVVDDVVIVLPGGPKARSVVAYDRQTGERVWSALDDQQAYASPMVVTLGGTRQLLVFSASRLVGLTIDGGEVLWEHTWIGPNGINAAQPLVIGDNRVFVSSGYGAGAAVIELTPEARGFSVREVWRNTRMKNRFASSVLREGAIYGLDESILSSINADTGEVNWKGGRYGYGQLLLVGEHLIVLTEDGDLALVRATPERHEEIVRFPALNGKTWNPPIIDGGYLLVRNLAEMAAFDLRLPPQTVGR